MSDGRFVVIASRLRFEEARLLREVLESAGIAVVVPDEMNLTVEPGSMHPMGDIFAGAKVAVPASEEERARAIGRSFGLVAGPAPDEPVEITEEEWSSKGSE